MKICVISSTVLAAPLSGYGGLESVAYLCAEGLARRGHEVLFVSPGEASKAPPGAELHRTTIGESEQAAYSGYWNKLPNFDVVIDHSWNKWSYILKVEGKLGAPILGVCHAPINSMFASAPPVLHPCLVAISQDQADHISEHLGVTARVAHNGCFDGSTVLTLEGGGRERIDSFVNRRGREQVLAWDENAQKFEFVPASNWLKLSPENVYAVKLTTKSGRTLTSTPDNEIMTSNGWKPAHEIVVGETLRAVDIQRASAGSNEVRQVADSEDSRDARPSSVFCVQHSVETRTETTMPPHTSDVDGTRGQTTQEALADRELRRDFCSSIEAHGRSGQGARQRDRYSSTTFGTLQTNYSAENTETAANGGRLFGGLIGRRGARDSFREQSLAGDISRVSTGSRHGGCKQLSEDCGVCDETFADRGMERDTGRGEQQAISGKSATSDISNEHHRFFDGCSSTVADPIHDIEKRASAERVGFHSKPASSELHGELQRRGDTSRDERSRTELSSWDEVVSIERVQTPAEVFDLCTPTRSFVANDIVVHNCDLDFYKHKPGAVRGDRYLFLARMSRIKGPHIAVDLARKLRFGLDLVGDDKITGEPELAQRMHMQAQHNITYHGGVSRERAVEFFSQAKAMLHMNQAFREPFGLAPVEANACGLPVIAFDHGAMRETIKHGETGFLVKSVAEVEDLIKSNAVSKISAKACRKNAERFSVKAMVSRYEELAKEALECPW